MGQKKDKFHLIRCAMRMKGEGGHFWAPGRHKPTPIQLTGKRAHEMKNKGASSTDCFTPEETLMDGHFRISRTRTSLRSLESAASYRYNNRLSVTIIIHNSNIYRNCRFMHVQPNGKRVVHACFLNFFNKLKHIQIF